MPEQSIDFKMSDDQQKAFDKVKAFLNSDVPVFILKGYAGTGKTTMVKQIADYIVNDLKRTPMLMAPTGRAARVLAKKTRKDAYTIHKSIYDRDHHEIKKVEDVADSEFKIIFNIAFAIEKAISIVDESSMISSKKSEHEILQFGTGILIDDLLTFIRPSFGGKIIFVGDPAQLPPVGDNHSCALDEEYFKAKGLKAMTAELTQVLRQGEGSVILKNAMQVRDLLQSPQRNRLVFEQKAGEVEAIQPRDIVDRYMATGSDAASGDNVVIAYSNRIVADYNKEIRLRKYGTNLPIQVGESLMVVANNYIVGLLNGDFTRVISLGKVSSLSAPVWIQSGRQRKQEIIKIDFQDAEVINDEGKTVSCKLVLNLLDNERRSLTVDEWRALYINFCMRYPKLKQGTNEFANTLKADPYYTALQVKYGYAVTGHKCQGGEWKTAFVDYDGRTGLNDDSLRWNYTATTRAQRMLYVANLPNITPFDRFRVDAITPIKKIQPEFRKLAPVGEDKFHAASSPEFLRAKCLCITHNMENTWYKVKRVESMPYRERYTIETPDGLECYDLMYKGSGVFMSAKAQMPSKHTPVIEMLLDNESDMAAPCDYEPTDDIHRQVYTYVKSKCDELNITVTNVVEHNDQYYTMFYFSTSGTVSCLQVFIDKKGFVSYAKPSSFIGTEDTELDNLVKALRK